MKRARFRPTTSSEYKALEDRRCMALAVSLSDGNMLVEGNAEGAVEIMATGSSSFSVSEGGAVLGNYPGVVGTIRVNLDSNGSSYADTVRIDLMDEVVQSLVVNLGGGDNYLDIDGKSQWDGAGNHVERVVVQSGSGADMVNLNMTTTLAAKASLGAGNDSFTVNAHAKRVHYFSGDGDDALNFQGEYFHESIVAHLGNGDDTVNVDSKSYGSYYLFAGDGADTINFTSATETSFVFAHLGQGDNTLNLSGWMNGLTVRGGDGNDAVNFLRSDRSVVWGRASILLGGGENHFNLDGAFRGDILLRGGNGGDHVNFGETFSMSNRTKSVRVVLGDGQNTITNRGYVAGNLIGISRNVDDVFANEGEVDGLLYLVPGAQK